MNQRLDELIDQADAQLRLLDEDFNRQNAAQDSTEVDRDTARKLNRAATERKPYLNAHPILAGLVGLSFSVLAAGSIYAWLTAPQAEGPYQIVSGTVLSSSMTWSGSPRHGDIAVEKVSLPDGRLVTIYGHYGILLKPGTRLAIRIYKTGAIASDRVL